VIEQARRHLLALEQRQTPGAAPQLALFETAQKPDEPGAAALKLLKDTDPDALTPKQALELLYRLKRGKE
jgi:DNA mismatch repair protein MutS